ncbi:hypothetical protein JR316_0004047 [Psilocybe cubensis]|uniref:Mitogen-activated protein kinase kinase kinase 1 n=2 Tax=Psilocybe cubensis TaxID=181762 RepID=A0A8H7Y388_PSICU|nr:hypothetical protein JR316_0004047 [Psilocybe cubensis]KAH9484565.1 hypothetical protein JR316_0004047 [Psilocybe cubensis]
MVLSKRKRDGEFAPWKPGFQDSEARPSEAKKTKTTETTSTTKDVVATPTLAPRFSPYVSQSGSSQSSVGINEMKPLPYGSHKASMYNESTPISRPAPSQPTASGSGAVKKPRGKKAKVDDAVPVEKRAAKYKPRCPQNIMERLERVREQRMYMVDRRRNGNELREEFSVLGSTGNVYTVTVDRLPRCNCPDATKGNHCKHILFVFVKVLQVSQESGYWYQKALLTSELEQIFAEAPLAPNSEANPQVREAYARVTGRLPAGASSSKSGSGKHKRVPGPGDDCPICYDGMHGVAETSLTYCEQCGNAVHKECFQQWMATSQRTGTGLTCVWCRAKWTSAPGVGGANVARPSSDGRYINLANVSGQSPVRDTSSYYHGPRRGRRYHGYQIYDDF